MRPHPNPNLAFLFLALIAFAPIALLGDEKTKDSVLYQSNTYHPVVDYLNKGKVQATDEHLEALEELPLETVWGILRGIGYEETFFPGMIPTNPGKRLVGRAVTIRGPLKNPNQVMSWLWIWAAKSKEAFSLETYRLSEPICQELAELYSMDPHAIWMS